MRLFLLSTLLLVMGTLDVSAQNTSAPTSSSQVWTRETVLGISEGVQFGTTVNNVGNAVGFTSSSNGDTIYTIVSNNTPTPRLWMTNGDFQANTNFPSFPTNRARFTEIAGFSHGILAGNCTVTNGVTAFLISNNPSHSLITYAFPAAKPHTTEFTGLCNGVAVGNYTDMSNAHHGFWYNLTNGSYAPLDVPAGIGRTHIHGISEGVIYGSFAPASTNLIRGFFYQKGAFAEVRPKNSTFSEVVGFSQGWAAGNFVNTNGLWHGFYWNAGTFTNYDYPGTSYTHLAAYNQGMVMGNYLDTNGFMQNFASSNVVTRAILITTNVWTVPFSNYPLHATGPHTNLYIAPANSTYQPQVLGATNNFATGTLDTGSGTLIVGNGQPPVSGAVNLNGAQPPTYGGQLSLGLTLIFGKPTLTDGTLILTNNNTVLTLTNNGAAQSLTNGGNLSFGTNIVSLTGGGILSLSNGWLSFNSQ